MTDIAVSLLIACLEPGDDPRIERAQHHALLDIIANSMHGVLDVAFRADDRGVRRRDQAPPNMAPDGASLSMSCHRKQRPSGVSPTNTSRPPGTRAIT